MSIRQRLRRARLPLVDYSLAPRDRILSATSVEGRQWTREPGIRQDIGGPHANEMVYYPCVTPAGPGRHRLYYYGSIVHAGGWRGRILSAVSTSGLRWFDEPGVRVPYGGPHDAEHARAPSVITLDDGSLRMYYCGVSADRTGRILSARSNDGLDWHKEDGIRLEPDMKTGSIIHDAAIVRAGESAWRMYATIEQHHRPAIHSAMSHDGLRWTWEPGVRIGGQAGHPAFSQNPSVVRDGAAWRMYFGGGARRVVGYDIYLATSADGLQWTVDGVALPHSSTHPFERHGVSFPFVMAWPGLGWRMYYTGYWGRHFGERRTLAGWDSDPR